MGTPFLEYRIPDQPMVLVDLDKPQLVVGSALTSDITIPDRSEIAREHLLLSPRPEGCFVAAAKDAPTPLLVDGQPFERGVLAWGSSFSVGGVRFRVHDGSVSRDAYRKRPQEGTTAKAKGLDPIVLAVALVCIPLLGYMLLSTPEEAVTTERAPAQPEMFDRFERACAQTDPAIAANLAVESARQADAKAERLPFRIQDGVDAVNHYADAAACFRQAGNQAAAEAQQQAAETIRATITTEARNHKFRLDRALEQQRYTDALVEAKMLERLFEHRRTTPFAQWLTSLDRRLRVRIEQQQAAAAQQ